MNFAKWVFRISGLYGIVALVPQYFMEAKIGMDSPPAITHPEYFYGFLGVGLAWQVAFLIIARDPVRYRWMMIPSMLEKISFALGVFTLLRQGRVVMPVPVFAAIDLALAILFLASYRLTRSSVKPILTIH